jgi:hypothetical protein
VLSLCRYTGIHSRLQRGIDSQGISPPDVEALHANCLPSVLSVAPVIGWCTRVKGVVISASNQIVTAQPPTFCRLSGSIKSTVSIIGSLLDLFLLLNSGMLAHLLHKQHTVREQDAAALSSCPSTTYRWFEDRLQLRALR